MITAVVVVLIPPAVEPGPEPTNIRIACVVVVPTDSCCKFIVENPAFLVENVVNTSAHDLWACEPASAKSSTVPVSHA